jgi:glycosyltransferase involved in cell wall biosynthesis
MSGRINPAVASPRRPRVAVAQLGARMHYAVPAILHRAGMLEGLYTDLCAEVGWVRAARRLLPNRLLPQSVQRLFARDVPDVPRNRITCFSAYGLARIFQRGRATTAAEMFRHLVEANSGFGRRVARCGLGDANVVYAFNGAALEILQYARAHAIRTVLEQVSAPVEFNERLYADERRRWPGWETGEVAESDWHEMAQREIQEWALADTIVCGSDYVVDAMRTGGGPVQKCVAVPYGVDAGQFRAPQDRARNRRLGVLCVATLNLLKGVQYLMAAARLLKDEPVDIRLIGPSQLCGKAVDELKTALTVVGPVPRTQMRDEYARADVFVLPTISEGSATVCYEALAAGLPVVTTPHAGSVVRDGIDGFIVPIRDPEALANRIMLLARDRDRLDQMSQHAAQAAERYTWDRYGQRLIEAVIGA